MKSVRFALVFAVAAAITSIPTHSGATEFEIYGGKGNTSIPDGCEAGWYMTGFKIKSGSWFDKIGIICGMYVGNQTLSPTGRRTVAMRGGDGGSAAQNFECAPNEYISSIWITRDDDYHVSALSLTCSQFQYPVARNIDYNSMGKYNRRQVCPTGEAAWGVRTAYGNYVNGLGLICRKLEFGPPVVKTDDKPPPCPEGQMRLNGKCQVPPLLPGTATGTGGGFIQMFPTCAEGKVFDKEKNNCVPASGGGDAGAGKATAVASNTIYKTNSGEDTPENRLCSMRAGDTAGVIETGPDQWVHLSDISGACAGKSGWAWNDGELKLP